MPPHGLILPGVAEYPNILQTTKYVAGDSGDYRGGYTPAYNVLTAGQHAGAVNLDVAAYAAATISFVAATKKILDSANGLAQFKTGDTIIVHGSTGNNGVYTVATGNNAAEIVTSEALANEAAGTFVTLLKRAAHSNNAVSDLKTGLMWSRYTSKGEKLGIASDGKLYWDQPTAACTLRAAAADLAISSVTKILKIVGGAGEIARYRTGTHLLLSGFANAANNLAGGFRVDTIAVNGADLDITLWPGYRNTLVTEAAGGSRAIKLVCNNIFAYAAAANKAALGGYTDWRAPDDLRLRELSDMEAGTAVPNATAFPSWPTDDNVLSTTTHPINTSNAMLVGFGNGNIAAITKVAAYYAALLRGS